MIHGHYKSENCEYYNLLFADPHREYPIEGQFDSKISRDPKGFRFRSDLMFDFGYLEDLGVPEDKIEELTEHFPDELKEWVPHCTIVKVQGHPQQLAELFELYSATFFDHRPSGDDEVYDYWPNSFMSMLKPLAGDLDKIYGGTTFNDDLKAKYILFIKQYGPVPEFHFDDNNPMPEEEEAE